jgi:16S rRNA (cytosine967-C5)-methyltransferase
MKEIVVNSYLNTACALVQDYLELHENKKIPLNHFLKNYFKSNSKFGKRDRKSISDLVYAYFKIGYAFDITKIKERIQIASFFTSKQKGDFFSFVAEYSNLNLNDNDNLDDKLDNVVKLFPQFNLNNFLPFKVEFTEGINLKNYFYSFFSPNYFFIRVTKNITNVQKELDAKQIPYQVLNEQNNCLKIEKQAKLQDLTSWQKGYFEIQDISSQAISPFLNPKKNEYWWDMCAASGGKSLLLLSKENQLQLLCTDTRESILKNLQSRFNRIGFNPKTKAMDLSIPSSLNTNFDGIICDAPCSGSGTWKRNPEELFFFTPEKLAYYTNLQRKILENGIKNCNEKTTFLYITCSVFAQENERQLSNYNELNFDKKLFNFYERGGNTLFSGKLTK